jgi:hypothetical protein
MRERENRKRKRGNREGGWKGRIARENERKQRGRAAGKDSGYGGDCCPAAGDRLTDSY